MVEDLDIYFTQDKELSSEEQEILNLQNSRIVPEFNASKLESEAKKHWDLFYKRNETRFFKDRHWTTREFCEILATNAESSSKLILEIGCGVGNFLYPLIEEIPHLKVAACDISPRAVQMVKADARYDPERINVFVADITVENSLSPLNDTVDIATLIFVLSTIHPQNFCAVLKRIYQTLKPGGIFLFRDYGLYDMAQLRFKPGNKISENFYMRQDGTRSYFFSVRFLTDLLQECGFEIAMCTYVKRRTVNLKEGIDVPRIFVQAKCLKHS